jgi:hypothetical protein
VEVRARTATGTGAAGSVPPGLVTGGPAMLAGDGAEQILGAHSGRTRVAGVCGCCVAGVRGFLVLVGGAH